MSHRLGGRDGVSVEAAKWHSAFVRLGWTVTRAAGFFADTPTAADVTVEGLWAPTFGGRPPAPDPTLIADLCRNHDVLVLDNAGTLPTAAETAIAFETAALRAGIPTIVRHHDPPWQVPRLPAVASDRFPLHDPRMLHVTINRLTECEFRRRYPEVAAAEAITTIHNTVDNAVLGHGRRWTTRLSMGIGVHDVLLVHPARNIERKNVPVALNVAHELVRRSGKRVHYWLTDPSGDIGAPPPGVILHRGQVVDLADLYAAADLVMLPSRWEGWGLPVVEAAGARRPVITFPYPVLGEIHRLGIKTVDHNHTEMITRLVVDSSSYRELTTSNFRKAAALDVRRLPRTLGCAVNRASQLMRAPSRR